VRTGTKPCLETRDRHEPEEYHFHKVMQTNDSAEENEDDDIPNSQYDDNEEVQYQTLWLYYKKTMLDHIRRGTITNG
jgi:hypothetical protein